MNPFFVKDNIWINLNLVTNFAITVDGEIVVQFGSGHYVDVPASRTGAFLYASGVPRDPMSLSLEEKTCLQQIGVLPSPSIPDMNSYLPPGIQFPGG